MTLRFAKILYEETNNDTVAETILSKGVRFTITLSPYLDPCALVFPVCEMLILYRLTYVNGCVVRVYLDTITMGLAYRGIV